ncbi:unnamed protein product, partial [Dicrocoelium dendriticum]
MKSVCRTDTIFVKTALLCYHRKQSKAIHTLTVQGGNILTTLIHCFTFSAIFKAYKDKLHKI